MGVERTEDKDGGRCLSKPLAGGFVTLLLTDYRVSYTGLITCVSHLTGSSVVKE